MAHKTGSAFQPDHERVRVNPDLRVVPSRLSSNGGSGCATNTVFERCLLLLINSKVDHGEPKRSGLEATTPGCRAASSRSSS